MKLIKIKNLIPNYLDQLITYVFACGCRLILSLSA